jgi:hypothetical protein
VSNARDICAASARVVGVAFGLDDYLRDMTIIAKSDADRSAVNSFFVVVVEHVLIFVKFGAIHVYSTGNEVCSFEIGVGCSCQRRASIRIALYQVHNSCRFVV